MRDFINKYLIYDVSYMFRTSWVHPQGESYIWYVVHASVCAVWWMGEGIYNCLPEDEPTNFETCRRHQKLNIN